MSDSELSEASHTPLPSDNELEHSLRREVVRTSKSGQDVTVRTVRTASEKRLGLPEGFYRNHDLWKDKSKDIITDQVQNEPQVPSSPVISKKSPSEKLKRASQEPKGGTRKKQKTDVVDSSDDLSPPPDGFDSEDASSKSAKKGQARSKPKDSKPSSSKPKASTNKSKQKRASEAADDEPESMPGPTKMSADVADSDSDLSSLIDEEPKPKKKRKSQDGQPQKSKPTKKTPVDEDPNQAEIKRLQGWLVKCGIRKVWGKELKPYETSKAKIKHLKDMLAEVGMTGRFSIEKANQIREARELAADIEAVKEGDERWGTGEKASDGDGEDHSSRKLVRGSKHLEFLSSDGEETD